MMNTKSFTSVVLITLTLLSCGQTQVDLEAEKAAILRTDSTWAALATQSKDAGKIVAYWSDDAVVIAPGEEPVKGKDALQKMVNDMNNILGFSISWRSSDVHFSPDAKMAYMYDENLFSMNDSTGNKITTPGRLYYLA